MPLPSRLPDGVERVIILDGAGHYLRLPKLTTAQRDALSAVHGMQIYNSTTTQVEAYQNGAWGAMGGGGGDVTAAANITDHAIVRGDGGAKGIQGSVPTIDDTGNLDMDGHSIDNVLLLTGQAREEMVMMMRRI